MRRFVKSDAAAVGRMVRGILRSDDLAHYPSDVVSNECRWFSKHNLEQSKVVRWVASAGGRIIGTVGVDGNRIVALYVRKSGRGNGVGSALVEVAEKYALRSQGGVRVLASVDAEGFYIKRGYRRVKREMMPLGGVNYDVVVMVKRMARKKSS